MYSFNVSRINEINKQVNKYGNAKYLLKQFLFRKNHSLKNLKNTLSGQFLQAATHADINKFGNLF